MESVLLWLNNRIVNRKMGRWVLGFSLFFGVTVAIAEGVPKPAKIPQGPFNDNSGLVGEFPSGAVTANLNPMILHQRLTAVMNLDEIKVRGKKEQRIYEAWAPSVVLIVTDDSLGSGAVVAKHGQILTNWHVVAGFNEVGVIFKPASGGETLSNKARVYRAKVLKVDEVSDLALIALIVPPDNLSPISLGRASTLAVGADVYAIGHPQGEDWTFTKGIISQIRKSYEWTTKETGKHHQADVIQTQTPINPGNSGGPLFDEDGRLVGINSFTSTGEGLNFAVMVSEVERFLSTESDRYAEELTEKADAAVATCETKVLGEKPTAEGDPALYMDSDCDGETDWMLVAPKDESLPIQLWIDKNRDGTVDLMIFDDNRDSKWDRSLVDVDFNGTWDLVGAHPDGEPIASSHTAYVEPAG